ncbi:isopenicillin N synthase family oxygenase [Paraglaciecola aquimarina]|uniref:2-oxoglutarate-dependent ethylene/succinate-forming enzyme n=1 Tax=Paraglaciecola algarum TaxID=3050085 RepID=A0ABS9D230_9ALTE|nr:2OG-Fe(II) oxygenase family protein [Paraglaciecola sp. G1-23]MCF2946978.1 isopenicillin N synthase family oxygenase [Paraglaciecola sp. G1-23]
MKTKHSQNQSYDLQELNFESNLKNVKEDVGQVKVPIIDLYNFEQRFKEISEDLWQAATQVGFFQLTRHGIALDTINTAFDASKSFFSLNKTQKSQYPLKNGLNAGWEYMEQVRPSTGSADQKESYQITLPHMQDLWPNTELTQFKQDVLTMEHQAWSLGMKVLSCFAYKLGFQRDFFTQAHNKDKADYQSTLRLLHYLPQDKDTQFDKNTWRAGAHTDFDCLTMVFQKQGQGGLQVCPGKNADQHQSWTEVDAIDGVITCNIGDMLMRWSDDKLKSTFHRVRMPKPEEITQARYSMAFFCQANKNVIIQGSEKSYKPISAEDYLNMRIAANFA